MAARSGTNTGTTGSTTDEKTGADGTITDSAKQAETGSNTSTTVEEKTVKYVGTSDVRKIMKGDWSSLEIEQEAVTWDRKNKFTVKAEDLSEGALNYLNDQPDFVVVDPSAQG